MPWHVKAGAGNDRFGIIPNAKDVKVGQQIQHLRFDRNRLSLSVVSAAVSLAKPGDSALALIASPAERPRFW